ncbi:phosphotransferase [Streptomyces sp. NPDC056069]|uniref:phosphotransferase n=1 Tax=Streptomyces sp. NPDC056069 TaxID=3345702 RepID=UPI0035DD7CA0
MKIGELIGTGRTADVYALDEGRVLRRNRDQAHGDPAAEAAVMAHLARHGYPVPAVWPDDTPSPDSLVMQRITGPTMAEALLAGVITPDQAGAALAELLTRLHAVPASRAAHPEHRILHLDLHPENVLLTDTGPIVIDWSTAEEGLPGLDSAMSVLILAQVAVGMAVGLPPGAQEAVREVLCSLVRSLDGRSPLLLDEARDRRAANPTLDPHEVALLDDASRLIESITRTG